MEFYDEVGKMAIGSRLRRLSETLTDQAADVYAMYGADLQPRWFPVFYVLSGGQAKSITQIANEIGHSHPSVSVIVKQMKKQGMVTGDETTGDGRKNFVKLTEKGEAVRDRVQDQYTDVNAAVQKALDETQYNLWNAIAEWELLLEQKSLLRRVEEEKKLREGAEVQIIPYEPQYAPKFRQLNEEWITKWFKMEEADYKALDHPQEYILDKGGHILFALYKNEVVGTCGLIKMDDNTYELAKMAVSPLAKGKGIGYLLGQAAIDKARALGANRLYLESNTVLKPAISLYYKLGFKKVIGKPSPYERANIQMELML